MSAPGRHLVARPGDLFRSHVGRGSARSDSARVGRSRLGRPGDAEVGDLGDDRLPSGAGIAVEQDVGGFQVQVELAVPVDVVDRAGDRLHQPGGVRRRQRAGKAIRQRPARNVFEHQQEAIIRLAGLVQA